MKPTSKTSELRELTTEDLAQVRVLADVAAMFNETYDVDEVLARVMDVVVRTLSAERGFIMLDRGASSPEVVAAVGVALEDVRSHSYAYSTTIVDRVLQSGERVLSHDALTDRRFTGSESLHSLRTRSILCVPMKTRNVSLGLIYLDNRTVANLFTPSDCDLLAIIADMAGAAIERARYFSAMMLREKMGTLGTFVSGIVHELNNPLTGILGVTSLALHQLDKPEELRASLETVLSETRRCARLTREMLSLARREEHREETVDFHALIGQAIRLVQPQFSVDQVALTVDGPESLPPICGDADRLTQVLLNLLNNARLAVKGRPGAWVAVRLGVVDGDKVRFQVADNGPGVPNENRHRIFEPFFTTRTVGEGTGLGLSIVSRIVDDHHGSIRVHNEPQAGAVFTVDLPARI